MLIPNKSKTAVHGCHCPGDISVCMREVLVRPCAPFFAFKGDVTQDDSQLQYLVQQRVAALLRHCLKYSRYEIALYSAKNRRPVQQVTLPL